ncbi:MAG TPA: hypothetical protein VK633_07675 [Verrucomicrobiae bacterium]|nr:hypothetical protein [Verrucomicrobiae bacterium]
MDSKSKARAYASAQKEQAARERGKALPHYAAKVAREMGSKPKTGKVTPSKRG